MEDRAARVAFLRQTPLLGSLGDDEIGQVLDASSERRLAAEEALCHEGEAGHVMYVVLAGQLVVSKGGKQVSVGRRGDCFGEMALIESRERAATLRALDDTLVLEIPEDVFRRYLAPSPAALMALLRVFSERSRRDLEILASDNLKLQAYAAEVERTNRELAEAKRQLEEKNRLLERLSALDTLTGIANRRRFDEVLRQEWRRAARDERPLSLVFCDIDHFKLFNDTYGHQAGDECLMRVAQAIEETLNRPADLAARYGGEEFIGLLVDTELDGAHALAERIRERVLSLQFRHEASPSGPWLTVSLGVACVVPRAGARSEDLVLLADRALYAAKQQGRNRVARAHELPPASAGSQ